MTKRVQRIVFSCFALGVTVAGLATPAHAQNGQRRAAPAATRQLTSAEIQLQQLVNQLNQAVAVQHAQALARAQAVARAQAAAGGGRLAAGTPGTIGGFSLGTPNVNPMTVLSNHADAIRNQPTPMGQTLGLINGINTQSTINQAGTWVTIGGYRYWRRY